MLDCWFKCLFPMGSTIGIGPHEVEVTRSNHLISLPLVLKLTLKKKFHCNIVLVSQQFFYAVSCHCRYLECKNLWNGMVFGFPIFFSSQYFEFISFVEVIKITLFLTNQIIGHAIVAPVVCPQVHNEREIDRVLEIEGIELIGINNRNLGNFFQLL